MIDPKEMLTTLVDRFAVTAKVQNVFGEPIEAHGKTIIPVARVSYRLGAGGGSGEKAPDSAEAQRGGGGGARRSRSGCSCRSGGDHGSRSAFRALLRSANGCRVGRGRSCVRAAVAAIVPAALSASLLSARRDLQTISA